VLGSEPWKVALGVFAACDKLPITSVGI